MTQNSSSRNISNPTPAHSLLAMILQAGGTAKLANGKLEIGPAKLANKLRDQIITHKPEIIGLLLGIRCSLCGGMLRIGGLTRGQFEKTPDGAYSLPRYCENCGKLAEALIQSDFPVFDKSGKEI